MKTKNKNSINTKNARKHFALTQVFLLVFSIIAISFILGSSVPSVSAAEIPGSYTLKSDNSVTVNSNSVSEIQAALNEVNNKINSPQNLAITATNMANLQDDKVELTLMLSQSVQNAATTKNQQTTSPLNGNGGAQAGNNVKKVLTTTITSVGTGELSNVAKKGIKKLLKITTPSAVTASKVAGSGSTINSVPEIPLNGVTGENSLINPSTTPTKQLTKKGVGSALSNFKDFLQGTAGGNSDLSIIGRLGAYVAIAAAADIVANQLARVFGVSPDQASVIGNSVGIATFFSLSLPTGFGGASLGVAETFSGIGAFGVGIGLAAVYFLFTYKKEAGEVAKYQCLPYTAPSGKNADCSVCNQGPFPCTEYQCKSLGQDCKLFTSNGKAMCVSSARGDVAAPVISPLESALQDNYKYVNLTTNFPQDRGVKVVNENNKNGCVNPFQDISFGVSLNEPGICKFDYNRTSSYDTMQNQFLNNGQPLLNSTLHLTFPDSKSMNESGFSYSSLFNQVYVRCKDAVGNKDLANFVFQFCVDPAPDISPPVILEANPLNASPIQFNATKVDATFYVNKPSSCRWANQNMKYSDMPNNMTCASSIEQGVTTKNTIAYPCTTTLTGLVNYQKNNFYVSCESFPGRNESERATMTNSYKYELTLTRPLEITSITPNATTIKSSASVIPVTITANTLAGSDNGIAYCKYQLNNQGTPTLMYKTGAPTSTQDLNLASGTYKLKVTCTDDANNAATKETTFTVESDTTPPQITRAYYSENNLNIVTDENSTCVYSTDSCSYQFADGIKMDGLTGTTHSIPWDTNSNMYIKCEDNYGNYPLPGDCSIVVKAYNSNSTN